MAAVELSIFSNRRKLNLIVCLYICKGVAYFNVAFIFFIFFI